ncbi:MAG: hypothetical protein ACR2FU_10920 [Streptosporangiaceae bacterium]
MGSASPTASLEQVLPFCYIATVGSALIDRHARTEPGDLARQADTTRTFLRTLTPALTGGPSHVQRGFRTARPGIESFGAQDAAQDGPSVRNGRPANGPGGEPAMHHSVRAHHAARRDSSRTLGL